MSNDVKRRFSLELSLCFNCLELGQFAFWCKFYNMCRACSGKHYSVIHGLRIFTRRSNANNHRNVSTRKTALSMQMFQTWCPISAFASCSKRSVGFSEYFIAVLDFAIQISIIYTSSIETKTWSNKNKSYLCYHWHFM